MIRPEFNPNRVAVRNKIFTQSVIFDTGETAQAGGARAHSHAATGTPGLSGSGANCV